MPIINAMMKAIRIPLIVLLLLAMSPASKLGAQAAPDFTATDCSNVPHSLHPMLDSGYVVVIVWVMPCFSCLSPALTAYTMVQNALLTHPGKVRYLLVDDYANTSCSTVASWGSSNGITAPWAVFSDTAINMKAFGSPGMPKVVIVCGSSHAVLFNQNNSIDAGAFSTALTDAIECASQTGIADAEAASSLSLYPNPSTDGQVSLVYTLPSGGPVSIFIANQLGETILALPQGWRNPGEHQCSIGTSTLPEGIYHVTIAAEGLRSSTRLIISK